jgi:alkylation response protein AidB-like acyl-CoA dehydrogenase
LGRYCGSTALTLSMHTHSLATIVWRWRRDPARFDNFLRRAVEQRLQLVTSGASDWLDGSGNAVRTKGGWRVSGRKIFASGSPCGDLLMTTAVDASRLVVLHFALPLKAADVTVVDNWRALGMRGTGSGDVVITDVFVPDDAISLQRPTGKWVEPLHLAHTIALPLVFSCYLGIAEELRDRVVAALAKRTEDKAICGLVGDLEVELASATMAHRDMVDAAVTLEPDQQRQIACLLIVLSSAAVSFVWRTSRWKRSAAAPTFATPGSNDYSAISKQPDFIDDRCGSNVTTAVRWPSVANSGAKGHAFERASTESKLYTGGKCHVSRLRTQAYAKK